MRDNQRDFKKPQNKFRYRLNDQIRIREVRVIGPEGDQLGILPTYIALQKAYDSGLDLIEIAPTARPPVCKIADYGKLLYELNKKEKQNKQKGQTVKIIQLTPNIGENDLMRKIGAAQKFLDEGHRVMVQVTMKGREAKHTKLVQENTIKKVQAELKNATMEQVQLLGLKIMANFIHSPGASKTEVKKPEVKKPEVKNANPGRIETSALKPEKN